MSSFDYPRIAQTVQGLLTKFGAVAQVVYAPLPGEYDPDTGNVDPGAGATSDVTAALFDVADKMIDGSLILMGDKTAYASAVGLDPDPAPGDKLAWTDGEVYTIVRTKRLSPDGATVVLHEWLVRK